MILVSFQILGSSELVQNCYKFTPISRRILGDLHAVHDAPITRPIMAASNASFTPRKFTVSLQKFQLVFL
jgi:hypothetical protein